MAKFEFAIRLKELRKKNGFTQKDIKKFKQASVSKIESRADIKLSTLVKYLDAIGMDLEIQAVVRKGRLAGERFELLNTALRKEEKEKEKDKKKKKKDKEGKDSKEKGGKGKDKDPKGKDSKDKSKKSKSKSPKTDEEDLYEKNSEPRASSEDDNGADKVTAHPEVPPHKMARILEF